MGEELNNSEHLATVIQTQTPISPGNSGGPLFSENGKIVGINTWGADGQNLNFAVAVDHAKEFIKANPNITKVNTIDALITNFHTPQSTLLMMVNMAAQMIGSVLMDGM